MSGLQGDTTPNYGFYRPVDNEEGWGAAFRSMITIIDRDLHRANVFINTYGDRIEGLFLDMAEVKALLAAHINRTTGAHAASAISATGKFNNVQTHLNELWKLADRIPGIEALLLDLKAKVDLLYNKSLTSFRVYTEQPRYTVTAGAEVQFPVMIARENNYEGDITVSASVPSGMTAVFSQNPVKFAGSNTQATMLTLRVAAGVSGVVLHTIGLNASGLIGGDGTTLLRSTAVELTVNGDVAAPPGGENPNPVTPPAGEGFTLNLVYDEGANGDGATVYINRASGFTGPVYIQPVGSSGMVMRVNGQTTAHPCPPSPIAITGNSFRLTGANGTRITPLAQTGEDAVGMGLVASNKLQLPTYSWNNCLDANGAPQAGQILHSLYVAGATASVSYDPPPYEPPPAPKTMYLTATPTQATIRRSDGVASFQFTAYDAATGAVIPNAVCTLNTVGSPGAYDAQMRGARTLEVKASTNTYVNTYNFTVEATASGYTNTPNATVSVSFTDSTAVKPKLTLFINPASANIAVGQTSSFVLQARTPNGTIVPNATISLVSVLEAQTGAMRYTTAVSGDTLSISNTEHGTGVVMYFVATHPDYENSDQGTVTLTSTASGSTGGTGARRNIAVGNSAYRSGQMYSWLRDTDTGQYVSPSEATWTVTGIYGESYIGDDAGTHAASLPAGMTTSDIIAHMLSPYDRPENGTYMEYTVAATIGAHTYTTRNGFTYNNGDNGGDGGGMNTIPTPTGSS